MLKSCLKLFWQGLYSSTDRIIAQVGKNHGNSGTLLQGDEATILSKDAYLQPPVKDFFYSPMLVLYVCQHIFVDLTVD